MVIWGFIKEKRKPLPTMGSAERVFNPNPSLPLSPGNFLCILSDTLKERAGQSVDYRAQKERVF